MTTTHYLKAQPLEPDAFRPYGAVLAVPTTEPDFRGANTDAWRFEFDVDGAVEFLVLRTKHSGLRFTRLERHRDVSQTFVPLSGCPVVVAVAAPTDLDEPSSYPAVADVRAFIVDGTAGYRLNRGVWHSPDRYPLFPPSQTSLAITSRASDDEGLTVPKSEWVLTTDVDYSALHDTVFEIVL